MYGVGEKGFCGRIIGLVNLYVGCGEKVFSKVWEWELWVVNRGRK